MILEAGAALMLLAPADSCSVLALIPAYSHNDYNNRRPLVDALNAGYRGVEADIIRQGETLIVSHDRRDLRSTRTLAQLYLDPLRERRRVCGYVLPDSTSFYLNIEIKEADPKAFRLLITELAPYAELWEAPDSGRVPAVAITLVGGRAPPDSEIVKWPEYVKLHALVSEHRLPAPPSRIGLISIDYGREVRWTGRGPLPQQAAETMRQARRLSDLLHVPIRVHHVPVQEGVFMWLLSERVTLIGAVDLKRTRALLLEASSKK